MALAAKTPAKSTNKEFKIFRTNCVTMQTSKYNLKIWLWIWKIQFGDLKIVWLKCPHFRMPGYLGDIAGGEKAPRCGETTWKNYILGFFSALTKETTRNWPMLALSNAGIPWRSRILEITHFLQESQSNNNQCKKDPGKPFYFILTNGLEYSSPNTQPVVEYLNCEFWSD